MTKDFLKSVQKLLSFFLFPIKNTETILLNIYDPIKTEFYLDTKMKNILSLG